jgi:hypothetical protein
VVDSGHHDAVARFQVVRTIIEDKVDAAKDDRVKIDGVGVVHVRSLSGLEMYEGPSHEPWRDVQIQISATPRRPNRRRRGSGAVDELAVRREREVCLLKDAGAPVSIHPCHKSSHMPHTAMSTPGFRVNGADIFPSWPWRSYEAPIGAEEEASGMTFPIGERIGWPPERSNDRPLPLLVMVSGAPGSGKSTVARLLADELDLPWFNRDRLSRGIRFTEGVFPPPSESWRLWYDTLAFMLSQSVSLVMDQTMYTGIAERDIKANLLGLCRARLIHCYSPNALDRF